MTVTFPDEKAILNHLEKHEYTKDDEYLNEKNVLEAAAFEFQNKSMEVNQVHSRVALLVTDHKCKIPIPQLFITIDQLSIALIGCTTKKPLIK